MEDALRVRAISATKQQAQLVLEKLNRGTPKLGKSKKGGMKAAMTSKRKWDDDLSDPEEPCPDVVKFGSCGYGHQCGFCFR